MIEAERQVHPAAAVFPMLSDDELADLAEDIQANGLIHPIVLDRDGRIVDGRNRHAACGIAGIEPRYVAFDGDDPVPFILSQNVHRRHMSKGQLAMAVAMARLLETNNRPTQDDAANGSGIKRARLAQAETVLKEAPDLGALVLAGDRHLDEAYAVARQRKDAKKSDAEQRRAAEAKRARLRADAPDLAALYDERRLTLDDALAALVERDRHERERKQRATAGFGKATSYLYALLQSDPEQIARDWLPDENGSAGIAGCERLWTRDGLAELAGWLRRAAEAWEEVRS